jgi:predicted nucleic acid-binding Zn ribbon protein
MKRLDEFLKAVAQKLELGLGLRRQEALERWEEAAGKELARLSAPEGFEGNVLKIRALHPAALMELRMRQAEILLRLNTLAEETVFTEIRVLSPAGRRRG